MSTSIQFAGAEIEMGELATVAGGWAVFGTDKTYNYSYDSHNDNHNNGQQYVYVYQGAQNSNAVGNESNGSHF